MTAWNTTETVTTTGPEKVGRLTGPHAERLHHLDGLPPRGPEWGQEENARQASFDAPIEPVDLPEVTRRDTVAPGPHGDVPVRIYTPATLVEPDAQGRRPAVVWIHGGAFIGGDLDMPEADHTAARLAHLTGLPVVSVFYRLCHDGVHHPVPHEDCWAAYQWVRSGGHGIATDPARVAVGGASAGACLAATVWPPRTRRRRGPRPGLPRLPHRPLPATPSHGRARRRPGHAPAGPVRRPRR